MGGSDPAVGLPLGDVVAHGEPVGQIARAGVAPGRFAVESDDQGQDFALGVADLDMGGIHGSDQLVTACEHTFEPTGTKGLSL